MNITVKQFWHSKFDIFASNSFEMSNISKQINKDCLAQQVRNGCLENTSSKISLSNLQQKLLRIDKQRAFNNQPFSFNTCLTSPKPIQQYLNSKAGYSTRLKTQEDLTIIQPYYLSRFECTKDKTFCKCPYHGPRQKIIPDIVKRSKIINQHRRMRTTDAKAQSICQRRQNAENIRISNLIKHKTPQLILAEMPQRARFLWENKQFQKRKRQMIDQPNIKRAQLDCKNEKFQQFLRKTNQLILKDVKRKPQETGSFGQQDKAVITGRRQTIVNIQNQNYEQQIVKTKGQQQKKKTLKLGNLNDQPTHHQTKTKIKKSSFVKKPDNIDFPFLRLLQFEKSLTEQQINMLLDLNDQQFEKIFRFISSQIVKGIKTKQISRQQVQSFIQGKLLQISKTILLRPKDKTRIKQKVLNSLINTLQQSSTNLKSRKQTTTNIKNAKLLSRKKIHRLSILQHVQGKQQLKQNHMNQIVQGFSQQKSGKLKNQASSESNTINESNTSNESNTQEYIPSEIKILKIDVQRGQQEQPKQTIFIKSRRLKSDKSRRRNSTKLIRRNSRNSRLIRINGAAKMKQSMQAFLKSSFYEDFIGNQCLDQESDQQYQNWLLHQQVNNQQIMRKKNQSSQKNQNNYKKYYSNLFNSKRKQEDKIQMAKRRKTHIIKTFFFVDKHKKALLFYRQIIKRIQGLLQVNNLGHAIINSQLDSIFTKRRKIRMIRELAINTLKLDNSAASDELDKYLDIHERYCINVIKTLRRKQLKTEIHTADEREEAPIDLQFINQADLKFFNINQFDSASDCSDIDVNLFRIKQIPQANLKKTSKTQIFRQRISKFENQKYNQNNANQCKPSQGFQNLCQIGLRPDTLPDKIIQTKSRRCGILKSIRKNKTESCQNLSQKAKKTDYQSKTNSKPFTKKINHQRYLSSIRYPPKQQSVDNCTSLGNFQLSNFLGACVQNSIKLESKRLLNILTKNSDKSFKIGSHSSFTQLFHEIYSRSKSKLIKDEEQIRKLFQYALKKKPQIYSKMKQITEIKANPCFDSIR